MTSSPERAKCSWSASRMTADLDSCRRAASPSRRSTNSSVSWTIVGQGATIAGPAASLARSAHGGYLTSKGGAIDTAKLEALSSQVNLGEDSLTRAESALRRAGSPWLIAPLAHKLGQLESKLDMLGADEAEVGLVARELPGLLGAGGVHRYLLVVQDPVEQRGAGGVIADYGILTTNKGRISLSQFGATPHLNPSAHPIALTGPAAAWAAAEDFAPQLYPGDASFAPDFPTDAKALEQIYAEVTGTKVDGVISVDPEVLADMARVTGPVTVPDWPVALGTSNLVTVLLHDQYTVLSGQARQDFLDNVTQAVFSRLTSTGLHSPVALAHALEPAVATGHLLLYANNSGKQSLFGSLGATGAMAPVQGDFFEVVTQNAGEDKIDWFLRRSVTYDATYDPTTGSVNATATITLVNNAPASGEPPYVIGGGPGSPVATGVNKLFLSIYSPLLFSGGTLEGRPLLMSSQLEEGRHVYSQFVSIPPGGTAVLRLQLSGPISGGDTYHLDVAHQPTFVPDQVKVTVHPSPGSTVLSSKGFTSTAAGAAVASGPASASESFSVKLARK